MPFGFIKLLYLQSITDMVRNLHDHKAKHACLLRRGGSTNGLPSKRAQIAIQEHNTTR